MKKSELKIILKEIIKESLVEILNENKTLTSNINEIIQPKKISFTPQTAPEKNTNNPYLDMIMQTAASLKPGELSQIMGSND